MPKAPRRSQKRQGALGGSRPLLALSLFVLWYTSSPCPRLSVHTRGEVATLSPEKPRGEMFATD